MSLDTSTYDDLRARAMSAARKAGAPVELLEDIAQEALIRLLRQEPAPDNAGAWVRTVARNLAIDAHRGDAPHGWTDMPLSAPPPGEKGWPSEFHEPSPSLQGRAQMEFERFARDVHEVLTAAELALVLDAAQGMSMREIAAKHGYTQQSSRQKVSVARRKLREAYPDRDLNF